MVSMRKILSLFFISIMSFTSANSVISCSSKFNNKLKAPSYNEYNFFNNDQGKVFIQNNFTGTKIPLQENLNLYKILYENAGSGYKTRILRQINGSLNNKNDGLFNDQNMLENLENNLSYKANKASIDSYTSFIDKAYSYLASDNINQIDNKIKESNNGSKVKLSLLADPNKVSNPGALSSWMKILYGSLEELIGWKNTTHLIYNLSFKDNSSSVASTSFVLSNGLQTINFSNGFANWNNIKFQNQIGFWGTSNIAGAIVHEYGHAFSNYVSINPSQRLLTNNGKNTKISFFDKWLEDWFTGYLSNHYCHISPENKKWTKLTSFAIVNSNYGRIAGNADLFAEAFQIWLLKPLETLANSSPSSPSLKTLNNKPVINSSELNVSWEILNDFFLNILKKAYKV